MYKNMWQTKYLFKGRHSFHSHCEDAAVSHVTTDLHWSMEELVRKNGIILTEVCSLSVNDAASESALIEALSPLRLSFIFGSESFMSTVAQLSH